MIYRKVSVDIDYEKLGIKHSSRKAWIQTYFHDYYKDEQNPFRRPVILICPGGAYEHLSNREAEPVALDMMKRGFNAAVLFYSIKPDTHPAPLYEIAWSVQWLRSHAEEFDSDPGRIVAAGFSAGGHLAASLGTLFDKPELEDFCRDTLKCEPDFIRPDGLMLGYPVITSGKYAHRDSFKNLLGSACAALVESMSLETRVDERTPKTFMWQTWTDELVPAENSLLFAEALRKAGVPFEYHLFPNGKHGMSLASEETDDRTGELTDPGAVQWSDLFEKWVKINV